MVVQVGESPACSFDVVDRSVVALDCRSGGAGDDEEVQILPPQADGQLIYVELVLPQTLRRCQVGCIRFR